MRFVITGASGVVGRELVARLAAAGVLETTAIVRRADPTLQNCEQLLIGDLADDATCTAVASKAAQNGATLIHLAALTPDKRHTTADFDRTNGQATRQLMEAAVTAGVGHVIYLSSTHTSGTLSAATPINENTPALKELDAYGASKLAGEAAVKSVAHGTPTKWTIVRSPLVYGPGAKGSLALLARAIVRGLPLPLGAISANARDMIGVSNLAAFIALCASHPAAANETFVVRDGQALSTRQLVEAIAAAAGRKARLISFPSVFLKLPAKAIGAGEMVARLTGNHEIDDSKARRLLQWSAPFPPSFDLERMVAKSRAGAADQFVKA